MNQLLHSALPPAGHAFSPMQLWELVRVRDSCGGVCARLGQELGARRVYLCRSGRDALARAFALLARRSGRDQVIVPAYTCYSVPAAALASGLRVRLVDVDLRGQIDRQALAALPLDRAAAVVVCNLFGIPESISHTADLCEATGSAVIDDAAQAFGAAADDGAVGGRGSFGILSFGRGKPLAALGGGALVSPSTLEGEPEFADVSAPAAPPRAEGGRLVSLLRAVLYDLALFPPAFGLLRSIPALGIGRTVFDPEFARGPIDDGSRRLLSLALDRVRAQQVKRTAEALRLSEVLVASSSFRPILAEPPEAGVYPRLAVLAPSSESRTRTLDLLDELGVGAAPLYPQALTKLAALESHGNDPSRCPGAEELANRILTLPTHGGLRGSRLERCLEVLRAQG